MDWKEYKIEDLFESTITGDWGEDPTVENSVPVLRSTNFRNDGRLDFSKIVYRKVQKSQLEKRKILKGNILFEKSGGSTDQPAGRVVYCDINFGGTCSNFIEIARVKKEFDPKLVFFFLYYFYQTGKILKYQQQTTGIINFKLNEYKQEKISLPTERKEQSAIVEVLDKIDSAIEKTHILIEKQKRIKQGLMRDLLTKGIDERGNIRSEKTHRFKDSLLGRIPEEWELLPLNQIADLQVGYAFKSSWFVDEGIKLLRGENVGFGNTIWSETRCLPYSEAAIFAEYELKENDVVIGMDRTFTKSGIKISVIQKNDIPALLVQRVGRYVPVNCNKGFLETLLKHNEYHLALMNQQKGMDIPHLSKSEILSPLIRVPNELEQIRIYEIIFKFEKNINSGSNFLKKLTLQKKGLMQDLLTGKKSVENLIEI